MAWSDPKIDFDGTEAIPHTVPNVWGEDMLVLNGVEYSGRYYGTFGAHTGRNIGYALVKVPDLHTLVLSHWRFHLHDPDMRLHVLYHLEGVGLLGTYNESDDYYGDEALTDAAYQNTTGVDKYVRGLIRLRNTAGASTGPISVGWWMRFAIEDLQ